MRPGLVRLADQLESAAEEYAAAEQAAATSVGLPLGSLLHCRAAAHAAHWIRPECAFWEPMPGTFRARPHGLLARSKGARPVAPARRLAYLKAKLAAR